MSEPSPGDTDSAGQQPHEQPHGASEVVLVDDDEGAQDFQAVEQAAKRKMEELQKGLRKGNFRADYWQWLKPVLERPAPQKPLQCMLKCIRGGEGVCGKLLSSKNPSKSAQDHFKVQGCKAMRQEAGQARLHQQKAKFWQAHMYQKFPHLSAAAARLLSAHVTSCSSERNWSLFGNIFSKSNNRLTLERARKIAFVRSNISSRAVGPDEEVQLSPADLE